MINYIFRITGKANNSHPAYPKSGNVKNIGNARSFTLSFCLILKTWELLIFFKLSICSRYGFCRPPLILPLERCLSQNISCFVVVLQIELPTLVKIQQSSNKESLCSLVFSCSPILRKLHLTWLEFYS